LNYLFWTELELRKKRRKKTRTVTADQRYNGVNFLKPLNHGSSISIEEKSRQHGSL